MIGILICLALYVLGVYLCREAIIDDDYMYDASDVIMCFIPIFHYIYTFATWIDNNDVADKVADKFFGRK